MKRIISLVFAFVLTVCIVFPIASADTLTTTSPTINTVNVSTAEGFFNALASNTTIILSAGEYNLTAAIPNMLNKNVTLGQVFDGYQVDLNNISNLTIEATPGDSAQIEIDPRYAFILSFTNCTGISIDNIIAGHTTGGTCMGGVYSFNSCSDICIADGSDMYGCGTVGLSLTNVTNMAVTDATIHNCTEGIATITGCNGVSFLGTFKNNSGDYGFMIDSSNVTFENCLFQNNTAATSPMFNVNNSTISVTNSDFSGNQTSNFASIANSKYNITNNTFENNSFIGGDYTSHAYTFVDMASTDWFYNEVNQVCDAGLMNGTGDNKFSPDMPITRGMFVTLLGRYCLVDTSSYTSNPYTDVKQSEYYAPYANWAASVGIAIGTGDNKFEPDAQITREQLATMLYRVHKWNVGNASSVFLDDKSISSWAYTAVYNLANAGIINGKVDINGKNYFDPKASATRAEVAVIMSRMINALNGN